jgi:hypothetical protein
MDSFLILVVDRISRIFRINFWFGFPHFLPENEEQKNPINPACRGKAAAKTGKSCLKKIKQNPFIFKELWYEHNERCG